MNTPTFLLLDFGNTNIKITLYKDNQYSLIDTIKTKKYNNNIKYKILKNIIKNNNVSHVFYSLRFNNSNDMNLMNKLINKYKNIVFKSSYIDMISSKNIISESVDPKSLGTDIYLAAKEIINNYNNALIVDLGTSTTLTLILEGQIKGVNISIGYMTSFISLLNDIKIDLNVIEIINNNQSNELIDSNNTIHSLTNGIKEYYIKNLFNEINEIKNKYKLKNIILTGGDSFILKNDSRFDDFIFDDNLLNKGLMTLK